MSAIINRHYPNPREADNERAIENAMSMSNPASLPRRVLRIAPRSMELEVCSSAVAASASNRAVVAPL